MPVYKYFGKPAIYQGKPLFHILSNLKNFGVGRIIARSSFEAEPTHNDKPSFYRILWAQPLMDDKSLEGRVVAERVRHGDVVSCLEIIRDNVRVVITRRALKRSLVLLMVLHDISGARRGGVLVIVRPGGFISGQEKAFLARGLISLLEIPLHE